MEKFPRWECETTASLLHFKLWEWPQDAALQILHENDHRIREMHYKFWELNATYYAWQHYGCMRDKTNFLCGPNNVPEHFPNITVVNSLWGTASHITILGISVKVTHPFLLYTCSQGTMNMVSRAVNNLICHQRRKNPSEYFVGCSFTCTLPCNSDL